MSKTSTSRAANLRRPTRLIALLLCVLLLLTGVPVLALEFHFSDDPSTLPAGCKVVSSGNYSCTSLTLAADDKLTVTSANPVTLQIEGAFNAGAGSQINKAGNATQLTIVVGAALGLGANVIANTSLVGSAAVTIGADSAIGGSISTTTDTGSINLGANATVAGSISTVAGPIGLGAGSAVAGAISTDSGALTLGASSVVTGNISTISGAVTLGASSQVAGNISTVNGAITLGAQVNSDGSITTDSGAVSVGAGSAVSGSISSRSGAISVGANSQITGPISSKSGAIAVGADTVVRGGATSESGTVSAGSGSVVCGSPGTSSPVCSLNAAAFDCLEQNPDQSWDSTARRPLYTRLAGGAFAFDVVALQTNGNLQTSYVANGGKARTVSFELVDGAGSSACEARSAIAPAQVLTFKDTDLARKASPTLLVTSAYPSLRCRIRDSAPSSALVSCSSESFAVRPAGFAISSPDANADASGVSVGAAPLIKAGAPFGLTASSSAPGYSGTPVLAPSQLQAHAGALQAGLLSGSFGAASADNGFAASGANFRYAEVGYFSLLAGAVFDSQYTASDSAAGRCVAGSFSNQPDASGRIGCNIGSAASAFFGRFVPDHFAVSAGRFANRCSGSACLDTAGPLDSVFSYAGEDFAIRGFSLSALNALNPPTITRNYNGDFARFDASAAGSFGFAAVNLADAASPAAATVFTNGGAPGQLQLLASGGQWTAGVGRMNAAFRLNRTAAPVGPFEAFRIGIDPLDADLVGVLAKDKNLASQANSNAASDKLLIGSSRIRWGRVRLQSGCSSVLQDLPMSLRAEYWDAPIWRLNSDDISTRLTLSLAPLSQPDISGKTCVQDSAKLSGQSCAQPSLALDHNFLEGGLSGIDSQGRPGFAGNFNLWLKAPGAGQFGRLSVTAQLPSWLQYPWQSSLASDPVAQATFGSCSPVIYRRENY